MVLEVSTYYIFPEMEHKVTLVVGKNGSVEVIDEEEEKNHWGDRGRADGKSQGIVGHLTPANSAERKQYSGLNGLLVQPLYILTHFLSKVLLRKRSASQLLQQCFLAAPAMVAVVLSTPLLILPNLIQVRHFVSRHVCSLTGESMAYSVCLVLLGFLSPWAAIIYCFALRKCTCDATHHCCGEDREFRYLVAIVMTAIILVLPAVISFSIASMTNLNQLSTYKDSDDDVVIITGTYDTFSTNYENVEKLIGLTVPNITVTFKCRCSYENSSHGDCLFIHHNLYGIRLTGRSFQEFVLGNGCLYEL
ncbi:hypothetical protein GE061_001499 [Apolygus lucorum]|uniref:Uncharacterized protein n=1 Tax=Apolygus lucorum TaxID=248454 RepID=A0A6A4KB60_APOLU|nr:hypothetical protein GE061_001499 [Apolygus lucorum]